MDTFLVSLTYYTLTAWQLAAGYGMSASGVKLNDADGRLCRYFALSQDLLAPRGPFRYGDKVVVIGGGDYDGEWEVVDTSAPFVKENIDVFMPAAHFDPRGIYQVKITKKK